MKINQIKQNHIKTLEKILKKCNKHMKFINNIEKYQTGGMNVSSQNEPENLDKSLENLQNIKDFFNEISSNLEIYRQNLDKEKSQITKLETENKNLTDSNKQSNSETKELEKKLSDLQEKFLNEQEELKKAKDNLENEKEKFEKEKQSIENTKDAILKQKEEDLKKKLESKEKEIKEKIDKIEEDFKKKLNDCDELKKKIEETKNELETKLKGELLDINNMTANEKLQAARKRDDQSTELEKSALDEIVSENENKIKTEENKSKKDTKSIIQLNIKLFKDLIKQYNFYNNYTKFQNKVKSIDDKINNTFVRIIELFWVKIVGGFDNCNIDGERTEKCQHKGNLDDGKYKDIYNKFYKKQNFEGKSENNQIITYTRGYNYTYYLNTRTEILKEKKAYESYFKIIEDYMKKPQQGGSYENIPLEFKL